MIKSTKNFKNYFNIIFLLQTVVMVAILFTTKYFAKNSMWMLVAHNIICIGLAFGYAVIIKFFLNKMTFFNDNYTLKTLAIVNMILPAFFIKVSPIIQHFL